MYGMRISNYLRTGPHGRSDGRSGAWLRAHFRQELMLLRCNWQDMEVDLDEDNIGDGSTGRVNPRARIEIDWFLFVVSFCYGPVTVLANSTLFLDIEIDANSQLAILLAGTSTACTKNLSRVSLTFSQNLSCSRYNLSHISLTFSQNLSCSRYNPSRVSLNFSKNSSHARFHQILGLN